MADGGEVFGYFIALIVLICAIPTIALAIGWNRRRGSSIDDLIEIKLEKSAKRFITSRRDHIVASFLEESRYSFKAKVSGLTNQVLEKQTTPPPAVDSEVATKAYFRHGLEQAHTYWGIEDFVFPNGRIGCFNAPVGLGEDYLFYIFNNVNPLAFVFSSPEHPEKPLARFVVYCTAQAFVLLLYCLLPSFMQIIVGYIVAPIILIVEYWLQYMLLCPCLQGDDLETEVTLSDQSSDTIISDKAKTHAKKGGIIFLRTIGAFMALPVLLGLIFMLVVIAITLVRSGRDHNRLALFLWDGILFPFILNLLKSSANYWWFCVPTHINICAINIFAINSWGETKMWEEDMLELRDRTRDERLDVLSQRRKARYSSADFLHMSCHCLQFSGLDTDTHYDFNVCAPSCYCGRCCDACHDYYWEEANEFSIKDSRRRKSSAANSKKSPMMHSPLLTEESHCSELRNYDDNL